MKAFVIPLNPLAWRIFTALIIIVTIFPAGSRAGRSFSEYVMDKAWVSNIIDGDSIIINKNRLEYEIRLWGIDAPEYDQDGADEAKFALYELIHHKHITLTVKDRDKYGRLVATAEIGNFSINEYLVKNGYAWVHVYYCRSGPCDGWYDMEKQARNRGVGLWHYEQPIPPWRWKRAKQ